MRLLKKSDKVNLNARTDRLEPYREFQLSESEIEAIEKLRDEKGDIKSTKESEELLMQILVARGMESLLYPSREQDDWSGYVKVSDSGWFVML